MIAHFICSINLAVVGINCKEIICEGFRRKVIQRDISSTVDIIQDNVFRTWGLIIVTGNKEKNKGECTDGFHVGSKLILKANVRLEQEGSKYQYIQSDELL
jgi:hypothetical protein